MSFSINHFQTRNHNPVTSLSGSQNVKKNGGSNPSTYADVVLISTNDDFKSENAELMRQAEYYGLVVEKVMMEVANGIDLRKKIDILRNRKRLGPNTHVLISLHGKVSTNGVHHVSSSHDISMVTIDLLKILRAGSRFIPAWKGNIHINACMIGHLRKDLAQETGSFILYGGKKNILVFDGHETFLNLLRLIGENKKNTPTNQEIPDLAAEKLFYEAANFSGETVSLHKNEQSIVSNATAPINGNLKINQEQIFLQAQRALHSRLHKSCIEKVKIILERSDKKLINNSWAGGTPIHAAVRSEINPKEKIGLLIDAGADINAKDDVGDTALMIATKGDKLELIELLIKAGANFNTSNNNGNTALIVATKNGDQELAKHLINAGADINALDKNGDTALIIAKKNCNQELIEYLIKASANP